MSSDVIDLFSKEKIAVGDGLEPITLSPVQENMIQNLLDYVELVQKNMISCIILAGIDKDGLAYHPCVIADEEDMMFKAHVMLDELGGYVKERCLDSLLPIEVDE